MNRFQIPVKYIQDNFEEQDRLAIVLIDRDTGSVQQKLMRAAAIASERIQSYLRAMNARDTDVYVSMNALKDQAQGRTKNDVDRIRHIYLDIDTGGKEALDRVLTSPGVPEPHHVLNTSPEKFQAIWRVRDFEKEQAEELLRGMAATHNADRAATDCARVLRIPGFRNCKYEKPHYVSDIHTSARNAPNYGPQDFPRYPEVDRPTAFSNVPVANQLGKGSGGSQSEKDFAYVRRALERGESPSDLIAKVAQFRPDKSNPHYYATRTVERAVEAHLTKSAEVERVADLHSLDSAPSR
jgi:hypothetical protein